MFLMSLLCVCVCIWNRSGLIWLFVDGNPWGCSLARPQKKRKKKKKREFRPCRKCTSFYRVSTCVNMCQHRHSSFQYATNTVRLEGYLCHKDAFPSLQCPWKQLRTAIDGSIALFHQKIREMPCGEKKKKTRPRHRASAGLDKPCPWRNRQSWIPACLHVCNWVCLGAVARR